MDRLFKEKGLKSNAFKPSYTFPPPSYEEVAYSFTQKTVQRTENYQVECRSLPFSYPARHPDPH